MAQVEEKKKVYTNLGSVGKGALSGMTDRTPAPPAKNMSSAEQMFREDPAKPARAVMAEEAAKKKKATSGRGSTADNRMGQLKDMMPEKPGLISYETNPNMDWRQAATLNTANAKGYNDQVNTVTQGLASLGRQDIAGASAMDNTVQRGKNQIANTGLSNVGAMDRLSAGHENTLAQNEQAQGFGLETLGQSNVYNKESDIRGLGIDAIKAGANTAEAQNLVNQDGDFQAEGLGALDFPQKPAPTTFDFKTVKDKKGNERLMSVDNATGSAIPAFEDPLGEDFDSANATPEQRKQLEGIKESNPRLFQYLMQKYSQPVQ